MNALDSWRRDQGLDYQQLAGRLMVNHETASRYCKGRRIPARDIMRRIYTLTHGQVTANDFYGLPSEAPLGAKEGLPDALAALNPRIDP